MHREYYFERRIQTKELSKMVRGSPALFDSIGMNTMNLKTLNAHIRQSTCQNQPALLDVT